MTRKKDVSMEKFKAHVIDWWVDRVVHDRELVEVIEKDPSILLDEKEMIFAGMANGIENLLELIEPLVHEEYDLVEWAQEFVDDFKLPDPEDIIEN